MIDQNGCIGRQYRIYPNTEQEEFLLRCLEAKNGVYNYLLDLKLVNYKKGRETTIENMHNQVKKIRKKYASVAILSDYEIDNIINSLERKWNINESIREGGFETHENYYEKSLSKIIDIDKEVVDLTNNNLYIRYIGNLKVDERFNIPNDAEIFRYRIIVKKDKFYLWILLLSDKEYERNNQLLLYNCNAIEGQYNRYRNHHQYSNQRGKRQIVKGSSSASYYRYLKRNRLMKNRTLNHSKHVEKISD